LSVDEKAIAVTWSAVSTGAGLQPPPADGELPSTPIAFSPPQIRYNVYDTGAKPAPLKLTRTPTAEPTYSDERSAWGEERCYTIRAVETIGDLTIESDAPPPSCVTPVDTFPPAPPANLQSSPGEGSVSLIWDPNSEKDLAGYVVLRGDSAAT